MKVAILGDTHFGARSDNLIFHGHFRKFYEDIFFPVIKSRGIKQVIQLGDTFDRRKFVNYNTLHLSKSYFFNHFNSDLILHVFPGNHDIYFRDTLEVSAQKHNLTDLISKGHIKYYDKPSTIDLGGMNLDIIPWICGSNKKDVFEFINGTQSNICVGHFEIAGFEMEKGNICNEGLDRAALDKYEMVLSGHFHHRSSDGHIFYVGTPYEITWGDYGDPKGFHILDTETRLMEFVENPYKIHHKLIYDEELENLDTINNKDFSNLAETYVKVIVKQKTNPMLFDMFLNKVNEGLPSDVSIIEDFNESYITDEDTVEGDTNDTGTLINKVIDTVETNLDKETLKNVLREIYQEALSFESLREVAIDNI